MVNDKHVKILKQGVEAWEVNLGRDLHAVLATIGSSKFILGLEIKYIIFLAGRKGVTRIVLKKKRGGNEMGVWSRKYEARRMCKIS